VASFSVPSHGPVKPGLLRSGKVFACWGGQTSGAGRERQELEHLHRLGEEELGSSLPVSLETGDCSVAAKSRFQRRHGELSLSV